MNKQVEQSLKLLEAHYVAFWAAKEYADPTGHTVPCDTKSWSQILVSVLTGLDGRARKKGSDLSDGSDVKGANTWSAIDTPRFNGVLPAGRKSATASKPGNITSLDATPYIFFVLWDETRPDNAPRCRIWVVRSRADPVFREMARKWYDQRDDGTIKSDNFQLHPPRNRDDNVMRNTCGNLTYPLMFSAIRTNGKYSSVYFDPDAMVAGECRLE